MSANSSTSTKERSALLLGSSIKRSLGSGEFSDVQFTIGLQFGPPKYFRAHKYVLCLRSSVFCAMFYGKLAERSDHDIDIPDIIPDAFDNMLSFLYTDNVDNLGVENIIQTLLCADKYDLPLLVQICCDFVRTKLCVHNCLAILDNAVRLRADVIVEPCLEFIDRDADAILQSERFAALDQKALVMILQRDTLSAAENNIYLATERWALEACKANNMDPSGANRRHMLREALFHVRFPLLSNTQLADGPIKSGLLLQSEAQDMFQYRFATVKPSLPFSTQPRQEFVAHIEEVLFRNNERVFARDSTLAMIWFPAEIIGRLPTELQYQWRSFARDGTGTVAEAVAGATILRVSDILKPGQVLLALTECLVYATYCRADGNLHVVEHKGREYTISFDCLLLEHDEIPQDIPSVSRFLVKPF